MIDSLGRNINYMRISVTDRCNLRCIYCMPEEGVPSLSHEEILRFSEIERICRAATSLGIRRFKITGGEPLVRRGVVSLIAGMKQIPGVEKITMTTNGVLLAENLKALIDAGLDEVTVSLDTMDPERFREITRRDEFSRVWGSIEAVIQDGRLPLKINCVPLHTDDPGQLQKIALLAKDHPVHVRFIEMMPIGLGKQFRYMDEAEVMKTIIPVTGELTPWRESLGSGPARYYSARNFAGKFGFISAISHKFCDGCNRIRLTSDGYVKSCLQYQTGENLKPVLAEGDDKALVETLRRAIEKKPAGHSFEVTGFLPEAENHSMSHIGG